MDSILDETEARIAQQVRLERETRNWSLADLAERGVECLPHELRARMEELLRQARLEIAAGR